VGIVNEIAGRWLRVSSGGQDEANQEPDVDRYIAGHGYAAGPTYTLHDVSASKGEQDEYLAQVIADGEAGKLHVLVGWVVDRLDRRGPWATGVFVQALNAAGVRVETTSEGVISDRDLNGLVKQWSAREETELKAKRVRIAQNARKARGALVGKVGWGYDSICTIDGTPHCSNKQHDKIPMPTEQGRLYVKDVYSRALSGESLRSIARWLSAETGRAISDTGVRNILTNPIYTGHHTYTDGRVCECEALVTADMQEQVRKALASRLRRGQRGSVTAPALLIPRCLDCGGKAYRTATGGKVRGYAYYCRTCRQMVPCDKLDSIVYGAVMAESINEDETVLEWVEGSDSASERAEIKRAMRELDPDDDDYLVKATALRDALRALPEPVPGRFEERETGRSKAEAILEVKDDRKAMRDLLAKWGVAFARDGKWVRVKVNGGPEFRRLAVLTGEPDPSTQ
jgi:DNA invertase Pin-like site-specific DNA recombinase